MPASGPERATHIATMDLPRGYRDGPLDFGPPDCDFHGALPGGPPWQAGGGFSWLAFSSGRNWRVPFCFCRNQATEMANLGSAITQRFRSKLRG